MLGLNPHAIKITSHVVEDIYTYRLFSLFLKLKLTNKNIIYYGLYDNRYKPEVNF
jgi:hypothetical protein